MRIALVIPKLAVGGAERVSISLCNMLVARDHSIVIVTFWQEARLMLDLQQSIDAHSLNVSRSLTAPDLLADAMKDIKPDIMMSVLNTANGVSCRAKAIHKLDIPLICAVHARLMNPVNDLGSLRQKLWALLFRHYRRSANVITTPADGVTAEARLFFPNSDVRTMPNAIVRKASDSVKHERDCSTILWLGRLTPPKDPALVIRAFAKYADNSNWKLLIAGDGCLRPSLVKLARQLGVHERVEFLGEVADPGRLLNTAGCLAFASYSEALPTVLVEAMQCGLPIVSTDTPGGVRCLLEQAHYGQIVPVNDVDAMGEAMVRALKQTSVIPSDFLKQYEPENVCIKYEELFNEVRKPH